MRVPASPDGEVLRAGPRAPFAHASEAELGRILDFYEVRWEYEPVTFPILWNPAGDVIESFAPDFYLPDFDLFLELTTLKQNLVRKKNRKLRRLRELYPDIRIKLFYGRDFRAIMLKYGKLGLLGSLSGTLGQVVPERAVDGGGADVALPVASIATPLSVATATADDGDDQSGEEAGLAGAPLVSPSRRSRSGSERRRRRRAAEVARAASVVATMAAIPAGPSGGWTADEGRTDR